MWSAAQTQPVSKGRSEKKSKELALSDLSAAGAGAWVHGWGCSEPQVRQEHPDCARKCRRDVCSSGYLDTSSF